MRLYTKLSTAAAALLSALSMSQSAQAFDVQCPSTMTATWNQAANGRTNTFQNALQPLVGPGQGPPVTTLICFTSGFLPALTQTVQLAPGSVVSACGAQATLSGNARVSGSAPFVPVTFKTKRQRATPTYNQQTGVCRLDVPIIPQQLAVRMSAECRANSSGWTCPDGSFPTGN